ncbi:MAG: hypothetical protein U5K79_05895 [Cyclobacteriaceae bacterium]|nr:hypothetical protein [Cyclobacteriaceae bacterium]
MLGKQEFALNQDEGKSPSEVNLYLRAHSSDDIEKLTMITEKYIRKHFPQAITEYKASENLFEMVIFNDNQPFIVARLRPLANFGDDESIQLNNLMNLPPDANLR